MKQEAIERLIMRYKDDFDEARERLTKWWAGEDIGRPIMLLTARRPDPIESIPVMPKPDGWVTDYSTGNFDYRVNLAARACIHTCFLAEAMPVVSPCLGPNCLALYLGCRGVEQPGTVWFEPFIDDPEDARFEFDPDNFYWRFTLRLVKEQLRIGRGKFLVRFPDLIEGLDTLAAMRGTERLLIDLVERPDWVRDCLGRITQRYFEYYDILHEMIKDDRDGSHFWAWAPGRMAKFQCDFSAMISPAMFGEFMVPALKDLSEHMDYCMYHWDGPGAIPHHDHLLSVPRLTAIQWTPGAGQNGVADEKWWPLYHKTVEAGKRPVLLGVPGVDALMALKREFGVKLNRFIIGMNVPTPREAEEAIQVVNVND